MILALALLLAQPLPVAAGPRTVRTSGEGRVSAAPDVARVTLGVETQDPSLARANAESTARMKKVTAALEKAGIAARDVRTVRYAVDVQRSFDKGTPGTIVGYHVVNEVLVTVRDLSRLGALLDQIVAAGANAVGGLSLDKDDISGERARALERAMSDARARASVLAKAAGASLGEALQINEAIPPPVVPLPYASRAASAKADVPVSAGELEIVATVDVTFALR
jgi:uncharacterized protein YggE